MTEQLAAAEPYTTTFEATVTAVDGPELRLDRTYFYAESGGQPADRGTLAGVAVTDVQERDGDGANSDGDVVHVLAEPPAVEPGETVRGEVDPAFRTYCMRAHTASHALYGAGRRLLDDLGYGGFDIDAEKVRVDFRTTTEIGDGTLVELERLVNRTVWDSLSVSWESVPKEEALAREDVAFNAKTEEGVMADADAIRVVEIEGWDVAACGGTHVRNTREIGPVTLLDRSNPGEGLTRVEFAVGPTAIRHRADERRAALAAARDLGTGVADLPESVAARQSEVEALQSEVADLRERVVAARVEDLRDGAVSRDGREWVVGTVAGLGPNDLGEEAKALRGDAADVVALAGDDGGTFVVVAAGDGVDASSVVDDVTEAFGGGGGGSDQFAQGGGIDAAPEAVVEHLR